MAARRASVGLRPEGSIRSVTGKLYRFCYSSVWLNYCRPRRHLVFGYGYCTVTRSVWWYVKQNNCNTRLVRWRKECKFKKQKNISKRFTHACMFGIFWLKKAFPSKTEKLFTSSWKIFDWKRKCITSLCFFYVRRFLTPFASDTVFTKHSLK